MLPGRNQTTNWCRGDKNTTLTPCLCCRRFNSTQRTKENTRFLHTSNIIFHHLQQHTPFLPISSTCLIFSSPFSYSPITNNNFPLFVVSTFTSFTKIFTSKNIVLLFCVQFAYPVSFLKMKIFPIKKNRNGTMDCSNKM